MLLKRTCCTWLMASCSLCMSQSAEFDHSASTSNKCNHALAELCECICSPSVYTCVYGVCVAQCVSLLVFILAMFSLFLLYIALVKQLLNYCSVLLNLHVQSTSRALARYVLDPKVSLASSLGGAPSLPGAMRRQGWNNQSTTVGFAGDQNI